MKSTPPLEILRALCAKRGLEFENADPFSSALARISCSRTGRSFFAGTGSLPSYPGNDAVLAGIANDKAFTYALMRRLGVGTPGGDYFFTRKEFIDQRPPGKERDAARRFAAAHFERSDAPLVVKPNRLSRARFVTLARDPDEAMADFEALAAVDLIGHFQPLIEAPEFRLFIVNGEIVFGYRKGRPVIISDGRRTIEALAASARDAGLVNPRYLAQELGRRGLSPQSILPQDEALAVNFIANLGASGDFLGFVAIGESLRGWVRRLHAALPLAVMGIDVFSASSLVDPEDCIVTDVNASPALATLHALGHEDVVEEAWDRILAIAFGG
jgi:glutathione synthase/RimK-type ligase-like ATP-grasp enzyme